MKGLSEEHYDFLLKLHADVWERRELTGISLDEKELVCSILLDVIEENE